MSLATRAPAGMPLPPAGMLPPPLSVRSAASMLLPAGFVAEDVTPGAGFSVPIALAFMPDGRMLVGEKQGRVWVVRNGVKLATPMWQALNEVLDNGDCGLTDVAVDPDYVHNHLVYFLYSVDPDTNGVDNNAFSFGRLVRYRTSAADSDVVDPSTRTVLFGTDWRHGATNGSGSHTVDGLRWGSDGTLLVSIGDGAHFDRADNGGGDAGMFGAGRADPREDIGAFRSQYLGSLDGKLLRIDPATGHGLPSNPYWDGDPMSPRSRVWAYGLRNPFRFAVRPGTGSTDPAAGSPGTLYIGDVGYLTWEELDVSRPGGENYGWPCHEGMVPNADYQSVSPSHTGCDSIGIGPWDPRTPTLPVVSYHHTDPTAGVPQGFIGNTAIGGAFYTGSSYPGVYHNAYFWADYGADFIRVLLTDPGDGLVTVLPFATAAGGPVEVLSHPQTGDLYLVALNDFTVYRIRYTGTQPGNTAPVAWAAGAPASGPVPLAVAFSSLGSYDLDGDPLAVQWMFGDGGGSTLPNPSHVYTTPGSYAAVLELSDGRGGIGRDTVQVTAAPALGFPTTPVLDAFDRPDDAIGGLWVDDVGNLVIRDSTLTSTGGYCSTVFGIAPFDTAQEAYVTIRNVSPAGTDHDLMLKVQGYSFSTGHIEVRYDAVAHVIRVSTFTPGHSWALVGGPYPITLPAGAQLGARAHNDGRVEVFVNHLRIATADASGWPFAANGGRIGLSLGDISAGALDDFGGGTVRLLDVPPVAAIPAPPDSSFYVAGDTLTFVGSKSDLEDPPAALQGHWSIHLVHNNHFHILWEQDGDTAEVITGNHDDGTGVHLDLRYWVTDTGALCDTAEVRIFPEADLEPGPPAVSPATPTIASAVTAGFWLRNHGRLPAHRSRWRLLLDGAAIAEADTVVAALDSVFIAHLLPGPLAAGGHFLRAVADTLGGVVETNEHNNAAQAAFVVSAAAGAAPGLPRSFALSAPFPNPAAHGASLRLELPRAAGVAFRVLDAQGRAVWSAPSRRFEPGRWTLAWNGSARGGAPVGPGLYLATVDAGGLRFVRRIAVIR